MQLVLLKTSCIYNFSRTPQNFYIQPVNIVGCKFQLLLSFKIKLLAKITITCRNAKLISDEAANEN